MDIANYEGGTINISKELSKYSDGERAFVIDKFRKIAEKGAMTCPYCDEKLILRAGAVRNIHFSHVRGNSCQESIAYDTYQKQTKRENEKHSVIKEIVYNELKGQEKINADLKVEYGHIEKSAERWRFYPDIYMNKNGHEFAISIITNVNNIRDENLVRIVNQRNKYFSDKGLNIIWFVEDRELADDLSKRVLYLWEVEYELSIKTEEDRVWDRHILELMEGNAKYNLFDIFGYHKKADLVVDVRSLYYVHSIGDDITFSVHRIIPDEKSKPYKAFAANDGYKINISKALIVRNEIILSDNKQEELDRKEFSDRYNTLIKQYKENRDTKTINTTYSQISDQANDNYKNEQVMKMQSVDQGIDIEKLDILEYTKKLQEKSISADEAEKLFCFLKKHRDDLPDYGLDFGIFLRLINQALGSCDDRNLRKWLVEIEYLQ